MTTQRTSHWAGFGHLVRRIDWGLAWLAVFVGLAAWFSMNRSDSRTAPRMLHAATSMVPQPIADSTSQFDDSRLQAIPISQYQVGFQVPSENPTGEKDLQFGDTVDPPQWRKLVLLASKTDGSKADVTLLRPLWWLEEHDAQVGGTVEIQVPECSISGPAEVLAIEPCPAIKPQRGLRIVTGTFRHHAGQVIELHVDGLDEPIGTTANHLFWSADRQKFVRADELKQGEHLRAFNGTPIVRRIVPQADPEPVFNLEVQCDHVYHVSKNGVLVHNSGLCPQQLLAQLDLPVDAQRALLRGVLGTARSGRHAHHLIPLEMITTHRELLKRAARGGFDINGATNGIGLLPRLEHSSHPWYNNQCRQVLDDLEFQLRNATDSEVASALQSLANNAREAIRKGFTPNF